MIDGEPDPINLGGHVVMSRNATHHNVGPKLYFHFKRPAPDALIKFPFLLVCICIVLYCSQLFNFILTASPAACFKLTFKSRNIKQENLYARYVQKGEVLSSGICQVQT